MYDFCLYLTHTTNSCFNQKLHQKTKLIDIYGLKSIYFVKFTFNYGHVLKKKSVYPKLNLVWPIKFTHILIIKHFYKSSMKDFVG